MSKYVLASFLMMAPGACGDDPSLEPGTARIEGLIDGRSIEPKTAFLTVHPFVPLEVLLLSENRDIDCNLTHGFTGLVGVIGFYCGPASARTFAVVVGSDIDCVPDNEVFMVVEGVDVVQEYSAKSGSVTVFDRDEETLTGRFNARFPGHGALSGEFSALICPQAAR